MKAKEIMSIIQDTLYQLENNAAQSLSQKDVKSADMYMNYATGIRMVLDNIHYKM